MEQIKIPSEMYERLAKHAQGFDTPKNVINRLLNHYEGLPERPHNQPIDIQSNHHDTTKYQFNNNTYNKRKLVLAVIEQYASDHPETTLKKLLLKFPKKLQGSIGVFDELSFVKNKYGDKGHKRHFLKDNEVIQLSDCTIAVSTEWGSGNINQFIEQAEKHGYTISPTNV